jgi:hypothetical protein
MDHNNGWTLADHPCSSNIRRFIAVAQTLLLARRRRRWRRRYTQLGLELLDSVAEEAGEADSLLAGRRLHEPKEERNKLYSISRTLGLLSLTPLPGWRVRCSLCTGLCLCNRATCSLTRRTARWRSRCSTSQSDVTIHDTEAIHPPKEPPG